MRKTTSILALTLAVAVVLSASAVFAADELAIGATAPAFELPGVDGRSYSLAKDSGAKGTLVVFTCNTCPYSQAYEDRIIELTRAYTPKGVTLLAINSNDKAVDSFEEMKKRSVAKKYPFAYLRDESGAIAKAYGARVTPHVFLLDARGKLAYRGRIDDSSKLEEVKARDLVSALDALLAGKPIAVASTKAFGCGIKLKS